MITGEYDNGGFNPTSVAMLIITTTVAVILIQAFQIPVITDMQGKDGKIHYGDTYDRTFTTNLSDDEVEWYFSGDIPQQYYTVTGSHIHIQWGKDTPESDFEYKTYTLHVTAYSHKPDQSQSETITFVLSPPSHYKQMILLIPTLLIMAVIVFVIRPLRNRDGGDYGGDYGGGYSNSDIQGRI